MKRFLIHATAVGTAVLCACSSVEQVCVGYATPASVVSLKSGSKIQLVSAGDRSIADPVTGAFAAAIRKNGQFQLADGNADVRIVVTGNKSYRADDAGALPFNRRVAERSVSDSTGGHDYIERTDSVSASSSALVSLAVYRENDLSPVMYMDLPQFDSYFGPGPVPSQAEWERQFLETALKTIKTAFLPGTRESTTLIPKNADSKQLNPALKAGEYKNVISLGAEWFPAGPDAFLDEVVSGKYKADATLREQLLSACYVLSIAEEAVASDSVTMRKLLNRHLAILSLTREDGLRTACPDTLVRIENKLRLLRAAGK